MPTDTTDQQPAADTPAPPAALEWQLIQALGRTMQLEGVVIPALASELRRFQRAYGRASATIGAERGTTARLREQLREIDIREEVIRNRVAGEGPAAQASVTRLHARCAEILADSHRHIAIGEVLRILGIPQ